MNDELQNKLVAYLDRIEQGVDSGGEFLASEAPIFAAELLAWLFWSNILTGIGFLLAILMLGIVAYFLVQGMKSDDELVPPGLFALILLATFALMFASFAFTSFANAVKVKVAPRVVVVEELSKLSRQVTQSDRAN